MGVPPSGVRGMRPDPPPPQLHKSGRHTLTDYGRRTEHVMSIDDLKKALTRDKPKAAIVVSAKLFRQLYEAAELRPRRQRWEAPSDAACKKVLDTYLQLERLPMSDQLFTVTWHLTAHNEVRIVKDADLFLTLRDRGPNSFEFV